MLSKRKDINSINLIKVEFNYDHFQDIKAKAEFLNSLNSEVKKDSERSKRDKINLKIEKENYKKKVSSQKLIGSSCQSQNQSLNASTISNLSGYYKNTRSQKICQILVNMFYKLHLLRKSLFFENLNRYLKLRDIVT